MDKPNRVPVTSQPPPPQNSETLERINTLIAFTWLAVAMYLIYEISIAKLTEVPHPFWDLFANSKGQGGRIAIFYILGALFLTPIMGLLTYIILRFAVTMIEQGLLKIFPASWVVVLLPLILLLALMPGFSQKHEIKLWIMSAYAQVNDAMQVASEFDPKTKVGPKDGMREEDNPEIR